MPLNNSAEQADANTSFGQPPRGLPARLLAWPPDSGPVTHASDASLPKNPSELLQGLVKQTQLLACLQWLGEFQILAYIPLTQRVAYADLADLTGVPSGQIRRIVQTTVTVGFLYEPQPDHVAHTPLSVQFVKRPSFLDALMFIAETIVPTALRMAEATRQPDTNPYQIATSSSSSLAAACEKDAKLQRRASAFQRLMATDRANAVIHALASIDWEGLGRATVVEVNAVSTATAKALLGRNPALNFVVQMREEVKQPDASFSAQQSDGSNQVKIQRRAPGTPQSETKAAVYLLHIPDPFFCVSSASHAEICTTELRTHFDRLRAIGSGTLIIVADVLPGSGAPDKQAEAVARLQDLLLLQMGHDVTFDMTRLMGMLKSVRKDTDRITIVNQLSAPDYPILAFVLRARASLN